VSDVTSQKLVRQAAERPRGLLCYLDEMNSWVRKMIDRNTGEDRSAWVVAYESAKYEMDRVTAGSVHAENFAVSIYGNIQPRVFRDNLTALSQDGLLQRFVPAVLRHHHTRLGNPVHDFMTTAPQWENTLRLVYAIPPLTYKLSDEAYTVYRDFQQWYEQAKVDERILQSGDVFMTSFGKLEGLVGRLALLFHVIEDPFKMTVSAELMRRVITIVRGYVIPSYRYCYGEVAGSTAFDIWLTDYIVQYSDRPNITVADIKRSARRWIDQLKSPFHGTQMILGGMDVLEQAGWVARIDDGKQEHRGVAEWAINPKLKDTFTEYRKNVIRAKQRVFDGIRDKRGSLDMMTPKAYGLDDLGD
jgi:hypothetical protein